MREVNDNKASGWRGKGRREGVEEKREDKRGEGDKRREDQGRM